MIRAHKIRLNPTKEQEQYLRKACGVARFTFNWGLEHWQKLYEAGEKPNMYHLYTQFNAIKKEQYPWVYDVDKCATETGFKNLDRAFKNFFRRVKNGEKKPGYPKFKSKKREMSYTIDGYRTKIDKHWLKVPRLKSKINMAERLRFDGKIHTVTIYFDGLHWYACVSVDVEYQAIKPKKASVGIDLGVKELAVLSDGVRFENQEPLRRELRKLKHLQRTLSRRKKGSNHYEQARIKILKLHYKIKNRRKDYLHKVTTFIAKTYDVIGIEDLNVSGMVKNHHLAQAISDVSFYEFRRMLEYKAEQWNRKVIIIDRFFPSSKMCSYCGFVNIELKLSDRVWVCPNCGSKLDRDLNAARNIEREALNILSGRCGFTDTLNGRGGVTNSCEASKVE